MNAQTRGEVTSSLVTEVLRSWGSVRLRATGASMLPTLWPGDLLTIQSRELEQVEAGELVLFCREGRFFIHRVVREGVLAGEPVLFTRGDCMTREDSPVCEGELLGTVTGIRRNGSWLAPATRLGPLYLAFARLLCHWDLLRRVVLRLHAVRRDAGAGFDFVPGKLAS